MELKKGIKTFHAENQEAWRKWLSENHDTEKAVWLILYKKDSSTSSVYYSEAVDEAICFGWIDSTVNKRDEESRYQYFTKRNPKSNWSKVNKEKVARLIEAGLMMPSGLKMVELAKKTGTWDALNDVENLILPKDLKIEFEKNLTALQNWEKFSRSYKRGILEWLFNAKTTPTRQARIEKIINSAFENRKL